MSCIWHKNIYTQVFKQCGINKTLKQLSVVTIEYKFEMTILHVSTSASCFVLNSFANKGSNAGGNVNIIFGIVFNQSWICTLKPIPFSQWLSNTYVIRLWSVLSLPYPITVFVKCSYYIPATFWFAVNYWITVRWKEFSLLIDIVIWIRLAHTDSRSLNTTTDWRKWHGTKM